MKRTLIGLGLIASLIGGEALAYKGFDYPGKKTHDFQSNPINHPDDYYSIIQWVVSFLVNVKRVLLKLNPFVMLRSILVRGTVIGRSLMQSSVN